jgi:hypothetical protein
MPEWPVVLLASSAVGYLGSSSTCTVLLEDEYPESFETRTEKILKSNFFYGEPYNMMHKGPKSSYSTKNQEMESPLNSNKRHRRICLS